MSSRQRVYAAGQNLNSLVRETLPAPLRFNMAATVPEQIGKYRVLEVLGRGGMGVVYKAIDPTIGRFVAIKVLLAEFESKDMLDRFYSEAQSTGRLQHPNIVTLYEMGEQEGAPYLVMEFLEGVSLDKIISSDKQLPLVEVLSSVAQVCAGLQHAHSHGIIHRDVKPANVVLLAESCVKLVDFGIAKFGNERHTRTGMIVGSIQYMSPEQIGGETVDARSDIYSTGVLLYELLTRRLPFEGKDIGSTIHRILTTDTPAISDSIPNAPRALDRILRTALAKKPVDRYQTAEDLGFALKKLQGELQQGILDEYILSVKEALLARDWKRAGDQLTVARTFDRENKDVHDLARELRILTGQQPCEERIQALLIIAREAYEQHKVRDLVRISTLGLDIDGTNPQMLSLHAASLKLLEAENSVPVSRQSSPGIAEAESAPTFNSPPMAATAAAVATSRGTVSQQSASSQIHVPAQSSDTQGQSPRAPLKRTLLMVVPALFAIIIATVLLVKLRHPAPPASSTATNQSQLAPRVTPSPAQPGAPANQQPSTSTSRAEATPTPEPNSGENASRAAAVASEQDDWNKVRKTTNIIDIDRYLKNHPDGAHHTNAEEKRETLVWAASQQRDTPASLNSYLEQYPSGRYAQLAKDDLRKLDLKTIESATDPLILESFITRYPTGDIHIRAANRLDDVIWSQTSKDSTGLNAYLGRFPAGRHAAQAHAQLRSLTKVPPAPLRAATTASVPMPPASNLSQPPQDAPAIVAALDSYKQSYDRQDIAGIERVWPTIPSKEKKGITDSFRHIKSIDVSYVVLSGPDISGPEATMRVSLTIAYSLGGPLQSQSTKVVVKFRKNGAQGKWVIDSIH